MAATSYRVRTGGDAVVKDLKVSIYPRAVVYGASDRKGAVVSIEAIVDRIRTGAKGLAQNTRTLRKILANGDFDTYKDQKAKILPAATFSGVFSIRDSEVSLPDKFQTHTGLETIDVDGIAPADIPKIREELRKHPNVLLVFLSPSGTGLKIICRVTPIPTTANDLEHKYVWDQCKALFDKMLKPYGYQCDTGNDPTRLCFLAHDPEVIYNPDAVPIEWNRDAYLAALAEQEQVRKNSKKERTELEKRQWEKADIDPSALDFIPNSLPYEEWRNIGMAIKDAGLAVSVFKAWSGGQRLNSKGVWITEDIDAHWGRYNRTSGNIATWGTVVYLAQQRGYELPQRPQKAKLQRSDDAPSEPTETLEDNRDHRETATDTFLSNDTTEDDTTHILLIKDATGTGKTYTTLVKSKQHGKRTLMNPPHNDFAAEAVLVARQVGYQNPLHILGREHNWDDSGIADIPVEERTEALFASNNCVMVDKVKEFTDKRIAPRTFCELFCPFHYEGEGDKKRNICPHLAQYEDLDQRDFIASCTPNLLFDPNMRGYLKSLVNTTDELSDEELAIDAMFGTESEEPTAFDFAILDDYGINGLYTDICFSASDFKALKKAWRGTPTATFAKLMLKAFEKKKPQKIVKALRNAFETTAEHHEDIATDLTLHARNGTLHWAEPPISSKDTKRLLTEKVIKYDDGGRAFIPVDYEAYKELTEKEIPTLHPQTLETQDVGERVRVPHTVAGGLLAGVGLQGLTPVWTKGATPIELLDIFLKSIGNDKNAPINRMFRASGDPPVAVLTFSIPPQAPVGILPHIAMISATTDPCDTKRAFDGQPVTFSEHTGGQLEMAEGVQIYQFQDARLTSASVFEYPKDADGKRKLQDAPIGLKTTAENRLRKLNDWAKAADGLTVFISYKEFTEHFGEVVNGFDIVTHFDKVAGLNFDGLKYLVVFGYPKVKHEVVIEQARKQYASDREPLPKGDKERRDENGRNISHYIQLTEEVTIAENGITITERRYKDPRLEKVRHQLATEKLEQAIGRARFPVWTDTQTILFTDAPITGFTDHATLFSSAALNLADTPSDLPDAMTRIKEAEDSGDVRSLMETKGIKKSQAYNASKEVREQKTADRDARILELEKQGLNASEIHRETGVPRSTVIDVLKDSKRGDGNSSHQLVYTNYEVENPSPPTDVGVPCVACKNRDKIDKTVEGENRDKIDKNRDKIDKIAEATGDVSNEIEDVSASIRTHKPVPRAEYSKLTEREARAELQYCEETYNYAGAAYLRTLFKRNGWDIAETAEKPQQRNTETDVQEVADRQGVSERTAYRRTQAAKIQNTADRDVEIIRRHAVGESPKEISAALTAEGYKASEKTVRRVLNKQQF